MYNELFVEKYPDKTDTPYDFDGTVPPMEEYEVHRVKSRIVKAFLRVINEFSKANYLNWKMVDFTNPDAKQKMNWIVDYVFIQTIEPKSQFNFEIDSKEGKYDEKELWGICVSYIFEDMFVYEYMDLAYPYFEPYFINKKHKKNNLC